MNAPLIIHLAYTMLIGLSLDGQAAETAEQANARPEPDLVREETKRLLEKMEELYSRADYAAALDVLRNALNTAETRWGSNSTNLGDILDLTGGVYRVQGRFSNAVVVFERSLSIRQSAFGGDHPDVAKSLFGLASLYNDLGAYTSALQMAERSLEIREKSFGKEHKDVAASLSVLASISS